MIWEFIEFVLVFFGSAIVCGFLLFLFDPFQQKGTREMINYEATFTDLFTEEQKQYWKEETTKWAQQWADDIDKQILEDVLRQLGQL